MTLSAHESDSPLLPMSQIERLQQICPERVSWVFDETARESEFRRTETARINTMTFRERMSGIVSGLLIACVALYAAYHLAMAGHDAVAGVIGGTTVLGLVSAFVIGNARRSKGGA
jgi:uncharacterized membrane protein